MPAQGNTDRGEPRGAAPSPCVLHRVPRLVYIGTLNRALQPPEPPMPETLIGSSVLERFLRYVTVDTQSAEGSKTYPSTLKQLVLLDQLANELRALGLTDVTRDEH